jgi:two-component system sensor histidine kinase AdeS
VHDYNSLARRREGMAKERAFWSAAIAHELRTPVTILSGRLQGLSDGVFLPSKDMLASLMTQVEGLTRLIDDLRLLGLQENGRLHLELRQACLASEVRSVALAVGPALEQAGLQLALELDEQPVVCDPVRMRQALLALLENAMQYAQPGPLIVQARVHQGLCTMRVEDSGPGVAADLAPRIFDAFQRGDSSRIRRNGNAGGSSGSGLGLAVVQAIAQAHGGRAQCLQGTRGGALFELSWPA